ncbi:MAG: hypothetical protein SF069_07080 [Phycisphaerae bacterium]|nr:hypothetical protein [Phycisphaerae bacterium]
MKSEMQVRMSACAAPPDRRPNFVPAALATALAAAFAGSASAADFTARNPLTPVLFTIDNDSPTAQPPSLIRGADILQHPGPTIRFARANLGLPAAANQIDAISFDRDNIQPTTVFVLRFSVDRNSANGAPPDPGLTGDGFPFNARQQSTLGQAAGDDYISLRQFRRTGIAPLLNADDRGGNNNTLTHNQGDAGGVDYSLKPPTSPTAPNAGGEDNLNGGAIPSTGSVENGVAPRLFFSLVNGNPGPTGTTPPFSGADIYVDLELQAPSGQFLYANPNQLGLRNNDDIDALIVFEDGVAGFNPNSDQILFSLARGSASLTLNGWSPADVLTTRGGGQLPVVFAAAAQLGLGQNDELDMLELAICADSGECVQDWAIGKQPDAIPATTGLGAFVGAVGIAAAGALALRRRSLPAI